ncbi:LysR family transcriptional regulator [Phytoactinopolyspora mesophila]|nr:LysR substrate-binding domain-containing protein [Phytoactinopolyspora mesophila]
MDLVRHLEYFTAIAHERHFGQAAQRLGIRQPPLSQGLKRLETELGVRLCDRGSQGVTLTEAGNALLPAAHRVLDEVEQLRLLARRQEEPAKPRISVRVSPGLGSGHYAALFAACRRSAPEADVDISEQATPDQIHDLFHARADVGVLREPAAVRGLTLGPQVNVTLNCLLPAEHPAARAGRVRLGELAGHALALPPRDQTPAAHDDLISTCERHGFLPETLHEVSDDRVIRGLVASGRCVSFTTDSPGEVASDGSVVVPIQDQPLSLLLRLAWRGALRPPIAQLPTAIVHTLVRGDDTTGRRSADRPPRAVSELPSTPS